MGDAGPTAANREAGSLLAIDVGSVNTRATLIDVVDGKYRLVAASASPSTVEPPLGDAREGIRRAMDDLKRITGRHLVDDTEQLIVPETAQGDGVNGFVATSSAGPKINALLLGLTQEISIESARRLADSTYLDISAQVNLQEEGEPAEQIAAILDARPDLILIVGGSDGGARQGLLRSMETVRLALDLFPAGRRPSIVYAGNKEVAGELGERFGDRFMVTVAPNLRPRLDQENIGAARYHLSGVISDLRCAYDLGFDELWRWSEGRLTPTSEAFGRVVRYLSKVYDPDMGVLGIDLGASQVTVAAAFDGDLRLRVRTDLGLGENAHRILSHTPLADVMRWLPVEASPRDVKDLIYNKSLNPASVAMDPVELHIEFALAREILRYALQEARPSWPSGPAGSTGGLPRLEPILASGSLLGAAPRPGFAALALLDALQPVGVTTLVVDPRHLAAAIGAASSSMPMLAVQVLGSDSFISLGTVVSAKGRGIPGDKAVTVVLQREGEEDLERDVAFGDIEVLPLAHGEQGRLVLKPERSVDVGLGGEGHEGALRVAGGAVGVIIDARGRPLVLPSDPRDRRELNARWLWAVGGGE